MDRRIVLTKTAKGLMEVTGKTNRLSRELRIVLAQIDGKATIGDLQKRLDKLTEAKLLGHLSRLMTGGFAREFVSAPQSLSPSSEAEIEGDLDFTYYTDAPGRRDSNSERDHAEAEEVAREITGKHKRELAEAHAVKARHEAARQEVEATARAQNLAEAEQRREHERTQADQEHQRADDEHCRIEKVCQQAETGLRLEVDRTIEFQAKLLAREKAERRAELSAEAKRDAEETARAEARAEATLAEELERRAAEARQALDVQTKRAEQERKRIEEEQARADAGYRSVAEERRRARAERRHIEEAAKRANDARTERDKARDATNEERSVEQGAQAKVGMQVIDASPAHDTQAQFERELAEEMRRVKDESDHAQVQDKELAEAVRASASTKANRRMSARMKRGAEGVALKIDHVRTQRRGLETERLAEQIAEPRPGTDRQPQASNQTIGVARSELVSPDLDAQAHRESIESQAMEAQVHLADEVTIFGDDEQRRRDESPQPQQEEQPCAHDEEARERKARASKEEAEAREQLARDAAQQAIGQADREAKLAVEARAREALGEARRRADKEAERLQHEIKEEKVRREEAERRNRELEKAKAKEKAESAARTRREERAREKSLMGGSSEMSIPDHDDSLIAPTSIGHPRVVGSDSASKIAYRVRIPFARIVALAFALVLATGLAAIFAIGVDKAFYEWLAGEYFGRPVKIESASIALSLRPAFEFKGVSIGRDGEFRAALIRATPDLETLLEDERTFARVEIIGATVTPAALQTILVAKANGGKLNIRNVEGSDIKLASAVLDLPPLRLSAKIDSTHELSSMVLTNEDRSMVLSLSPAGNGRTSFDFVAKSFDVPFRAGFKLADFGARGTYLGNEIDFTDFDARVFDGVIRKGTGRLHGGDNWSFEGTFEAHTLELSRIAPKVFSTGRLQGRAKFWMSASLLSELFGAPNLEGTFSVDRGLFSLGDLARMAQGEKSGGTTVFIEGMGNIRIAANRVQLRAVQISAGPLSAFGSAEIDSRHSVFGRLTSEVRAPGGVVTGNYTLGGTLDNPTLRRNN